jgi:hypothetical protein
VAAARQRDVGGSLEAARAGGWCGGIVFRRGFLSNF